MSFRAVYMYLRFLYPVHLVCLFVCSSVEEKKSYFYSLLFPFASVIIDDSLVNKSSTNVSLHELLVCPYVT
jgi:hypothetical protein